MKKILLSIIFFLLSVGSVFAVNYPDYVGYVNDFTSTLSTEFVNKLNLKLKDYDSQTTNQIAVAVINTTGSESIEQYSIHLADKWKPGTQDKDNGILMTVALQDRKLRIEVGQGLEGDVTDIESKHIIDDIITPEFKKSNYEGGIEKGVDAVITAIGTTYVEATSSATTEEMTTTVVVVLIVLFVLLIIIAVAASPYTPLGGEGTYGITSVWSSSSGSSGGSSGGGSSSGGGTSFGGGGFSGGGSSGSW